MLSPVSSVASLLAGISKSGPPAIASRMAVRRLSSPSSMFLLVWNSPVGMTSLLRIAAVRRGFEHFNTGRPEPTIMSHAIRTSAIPSLSREV
jgi:hypothetical protein